MIRPVILCGGAGTRLWPISRERYPKQFLPLLSDQSLLQQTAERLTGDQFGPTIIVSGEEQLFLVQRDLEAASVELGAILLEPVGRNTAAAATLAGAWVRSAGDDDLLLLMPSDHIIGNRGAFLRAIEIGARYASNGAIVTFGAEPTEPNTQYGYIEADTDAHYGDGVRRIARFHEKPSATEASQYLKSGHFFWNCGIFLAKASTILSEMEKYLPETAKMISDSVSGSEQEGIVVRPAADLFARAESISIDHAVMEKTSLGVVVPVQMQWSDVGAWDAVWKLGEKDPDGNVVHGHVVPIDCSNSLFRNESNCVIGAIGLNGMAVLAASDAIFVAPVDRASEVKELVAKLKEVAPKTVIEPVRSRMAWGTSQVFAQEPQYQVHHLVVEVGKALPEEIDHLRSQQWVIGTGSAEAKVGGDVSFLHGKDTIFIPAGIPHTLTNRGTAPLQVVQIKFEP